jgi:hypothetical protein
MTASLDQRIGQYLSASFPHQSRRSFLSQLTRGLFALAGVSLPAALAPNRVSGQTTSNWDWCGLHGFLCSGNCAPGVNGNTGTLGDPSRRTSAWVACCNNPSTGLWYCVTYADYCGSRGSTWGQNCSGVNPSGLTWCGNARGEYICTTISVSSTGYNRRHLCARNCTAHENC